MMMIMSFDGTTHSTGRKATITTLNNAHKINNIAVENAPVSRFTSVLGIDVKKRSNKNLKNVKT